MSATKRREPEAPSIDPWQDPAELAAASAEGERDDLLADNDLEWSFALAQEQQLERQPDPSNHLQAVLWQQIGAFGRAKEHAQADEKSDDELASAALAAYRQHGLKTTDEAPRSRFSRRGAWLWASAGAIAASVAVLVSMGPALRGVPLAGRLSEALSHLAVHEEAETSERGIAVPRTVDARAAESRRDEQTPVVPNRAADLRAAEPQVVPEVSPTEVQVVEAPALPAPATKPRSAGSSAAPPASADELLQEAQRARASGQDRQAVAVYRKLVRQHPASAEAKLVLVSLGRMELQSGSARTALRRFDEYLQQESEGPLAQEAREGRIRALAELGRVSEEQSALRDFLARYPGSPLRARLTQRLADLEQKP